MSKEKRPCEAPTHSEFCPCQTCTDRRCKRCPLITRDHFTGRAIGKLLGISRKQINSDENVLWLSQPCHQTKDHNTQRLMKTLVQQRNGRFIGLGEHPEIGVSNDYDQTS